MSAKIRKLLEVQLNTLGPFATAWENVPYSPQTGTPWQRVNLLPAQTENPTFGEDFRRPIGLLQVTLFYPLNMGAGAAETRAEAIHNAFKRGTTLIDGTLRVLIERSPYNGPGFVLEGSWYALPVSIPYMGDVFG